jgi:hypothetical protein
MEDSKMRDRVFKRVVSAHTYKRFFRNSQFHPLGIVCSEQFVIAVLRIVQPKVFNRVLCLSAILGYGKFNPGTGSASKSLELLTPPFLSREKVAYKLGFALIFLLLFSSRKKVSNAEK